MMFDHSIKVPRLYKVAAKLARNVSEGKGSIKQLVYEKKHPNIKGLYALVVNTFQRTLELENLLKKSKLLTKEPRLDPWLAKILISELLWGKKRLLGEAKPIKTVLAYEQIFKAHLSDVTDDSRDVQQVEKPRYVRVNTLKITVGEAVEGFRDEGWVLKRYPESDYQGFLDAVANLGPEEFMTDIHIPNLLIFPPKTQFYKHPAYKNGTILLQDKASCLPVHLLNPERGATILDMCAAPGMKTTQTAAMIENDGTIYAVEVGTKRYKTLDQIVAAAGATCVKTINRDVLTLTDSDCPNVQYILVDPSCSGSGITDRIEIGQQKWDEHQARLEKLAAFQITTLRYALTKFPKAERVVYSTCSVYPEENEDVVRQVLETCTTFKLVPAGDFISNTWLNYGSSDFGNIGNYCLYAKPDIDLTSGFFVAVFERLKENELNQFLNSNMLLYTKKERKKKHSQEHLDEETEKGSKKKKTKKSEDGEHNFEDTRCEEEKQADLKDKTDLVPKKKKKKHKCEHSGKQENENIEEPNTEEDKDMAIKTEKKKKKDKHDKTRKIKSNEQESENDVSVDTTLKMKNKHKKPKDINEEEDNNEEEEIDHRVSEKKKKRKKEKIGQDDQISTIKTKKKKKKDHDVTQ